MTNVVASPDVSVDSESTLTAEEDAHCTIELNDGEPLWTIIGNEGKKRDLQSSSEDDETRNGKILGYFGSFVNSLNPMGDKSKKKAKKDPS